VLTQKFIEEQLQILRLTTPKLHPTNQDPFVGTPAEKRLGPLSLRMTARLGQVRDSHNGEVVNDDANFLDTTPSPLRGQAEVLSSGGLYVAEILLEERVGLGEPDEAMEIRA
jgi:hypothetical protein